MAVLLRLLQIIRVALKYRLDTFLVDHPHPWWLRTALFPLRLFPQPRRPRGERARLALEELGAIYIKFGQLLSTRPDLLPADIVTELDRLQDQVPPFDSDQCRAIIEQALGAPVAELFGHFDREPLASASVAQVHTASLHTGEPVVVKVLRPGIEKTIARDLRLLLFLARVLESRGGDAKRLRPVEVVEDYHNTIFNELNLQREAANASHLRRNFTHSPMLYVPAVHWPLVRRNVMVMERIKGVPVTDLAALKAANTDLKVLAERGVEIFFRQVFEHNFFHADMHPGNIFVDTTDPQRPRYIAVDMAIVASLNRADQYYLARNLLAMFRRDYRMVAELHVISGWVRRDTNINEFEGAIRTVCEPIFEKPLKDISFGQVLITLFQTARQFDMTVQPQLVLLQKTLLNIEGLGRQLYPDLDLWSTAHPFLERWLQERFHPQTLWRELKRYAPDWMEKFPQIPNLIYESLQQVSRLDETTQQFAEERQHRERQRTWSRRRAWFGAAALAAGLAIGSGAVLQLPAASMGLMALGALVLLIR